MASTIAQYISTRLIVILRHLTQTKITFPRTITQEIKTDAMKIKTKEQINLFLENTSNQWSFTDGHLRLEINFKNYIETFSFGTRIGLISEALNHHPTLTIDYNKLVIKIKTHSENGITEKDFQFVAIVNQNLKSN